jgi:hypothetical protein
VASSNLTLASITVCHPGGGGCQEILRTDQFVVPRKRRAVRGKSRPRSCPQVPPNNPPFTLSPRWPGGEGRVRGADEAVSGLAHLTLPGAFAPGPLPLPPEGRRGALFLNTKPTAERLPIEQGRSITTHFDSPDGLARKRGPRSKGLKSLGSRFRGNDGYEMTEPDFVIGLHSRRPGPMFAMGTGLRRCDGTAGVD